MESIRTIQEIVDENKESMPTGVVTTVQEECQKLYDIHSKLYKLNWTVVTCTVHHFEGQVEAHTAKELLSRTQTIIVEAVDEPPVMNEDGDRLWCGHMPDHGMVLKSLVKQKMPYIFNTKYTVIIVHSIEPYQKRGRSDEDE